MLRSALDMGVVLATAAFLSSGCHTSRSSLVGDTGADSSADSPDSDAIADPADAEWDADTTLDPGTDPDADPPTDPGEDAFDVPPYDAPPTCEWFVPSVLWPCAGEPQRFDAEGLYAAGHAPIMQVIAVGEASAGEGGSIEVTVGRTYRPLVLVLAAVQPVEWVVSRDAGASIVQILMFGNEPCSISGVEGIPVLDHSGLDSLNTDYCWPACAGGSSTAWSMVEEAEFWAGMEMSLFDGCHDVGEVTIRHECREECDSHVVCTGRECGAAEGCRTDCGACADHLSCMDHSCVDCDRDCAGRSCGPDGCDGSCGSCSHSERCDDGACVERDIFAGCEGVTSESLYCLTLLETGAALVGMDSGAVCDLASAPDYFEGGLLYEPTIAWNDGYLYTCYFKDLPGLLRVSLVDRSWELAEIPCHAVAMHDGGPLVISDSGRRFTWYPTFEDAMGGAGTDVLIDAWGFVIAAQGGRAYLSSHSDDAIQVYALPTGEEQPSIPLEGFDDSIHGIAVTGDGRLAIAADDGILVFDEGSGERLVEQAVAGDPQGLVCWTRP